MERNGGKKKDKKIERKEKKMDILRKVQRETFTEKQIKKWRQR